MSNTFTNDQTGEKYEVHGTMDPFIPGYKVIKPIPPAPELKEYTLCLWQDKIGYHKLLTREFKLTKFQATAAGDAIKALVEYIQGSKFKDYDEDGGNYIKLADIARKLIQEDKENNKE